MKTVLKKPLKKQTAAKKAASQKTPAKKPAGKKPAAKKTVKSTLLAAGEPAPFTVLRAGAQSPCLIVCDHANNRVPKKLKELGLSKADRQKHIAWDPGTAHIGAHLSKRLAATCVQASYSRLVVDLNRGHTNKECMRKVSDHVVVPGNARLSAADKKERLDTLFWPYHAEIDARLGVIQQRGQVPILMSIHSFTPVMDNVKRPWHIGVLWNKEAGIAKKLIHNLRAQNRKLVIGENEPYSLIGHDTGKDTVQRHAEGKGLPYIIVEFRQDMVATKADAEKIAEIFYKAVAPIIADPATYATRKGFKD